MRPSAQSHFRYPLTALLGTEAAVRVVRELALHGRELTTTLLAQRTGLTDQSVRNTLVLLDRARVLRKLGQGRAAAYQLDADHPVARMLIDLFRGEDQRVKAIYGFVRQGAEQLEPPPLAVWMYGSVARRQDGMESDLDLLLVVDSSQLTERLEDAFREVLAPLEDEQRLTISVVSLSRPDLLRLAASDAPFWRSVASDAVPLYGPPPESLLSRLKKRTRSGDLEEAPHG